MHTPLVIFGVSNLLSDIFDAALALGYSIEAIVLNQPEQRRERTKGLAERIALLPQAPRILSFEDFRPDPGEVYALGTSAAGRDALVARARGLHGLKFTRLVHPRAYVSPLARLGEGVFVGAGSIIGPAVSLGDFVFVNRGVTVGHDTEVGAYARLQPGANIGGHCRIGVGTTVGMGANIIEELVVGEGSLVAAGAVVLADVPERVLVAGVPAQIKKTLA